MTQEKLHRALAQEVRQKKPKFGNRKPKPSHSCTQFTLPISKRNNCIRENENTITRKNENVQGTQIPVVHLKFAGKIATAESATRTM